MASTYAGMSSAASLSSQKQVSWCSFVMRHNFLRKTPISAMPRELHFNKDASALQVELEDPVESIGVRQAKTNDGTATSVVTSGGRRRLSSPRAGRELAVSMIYASCLQGSSDPLSLFNSRINTPSDPSTDEVFLGSCVGRYDEMRLGGPPVTVETAEEEEELERQEREESRIEAAVLGGPPRAVYARHTLELTRSLLMAVTRRWDQNAAHINALVPPPWNHEAGSRILELCILHLAMSEIAVLRTRHQIVINEAVDLAKRFCDGAAPRTINGCLRSFVTLQQHKTAT